MNENGCRLVLHRAQWLRHRYRCGAAEVRRREVTGGVAGEQKEVAWQGLHDRHAAELRRFTLHLTHDRDWTEDIVQEVLLRAWKDPHLVDRADGLIRAWLFTVARHLVVDKWRSASSRHEFTTGTDIDQQMADESTVVLDRWLIGEALSRLSREHHAVIVAAYYEGRPVAEIAARLRVPEGTVKSRLHYGLRSLRLLLQEKGVTRS
jgi:RNA polymerase sigma-70 factor (ECF subfamily)